MLAVPYWLTGYSIDRLEEECLDKFNRVRKEFMYILEEEEQKITAEYDIQISAVMHDM